jgi:WS/DGAT/MGAT family acyltransferase
MMDALDRERMTDAEAVSWRAERDRLLRSTHAALWLLDRAPDRGRFEWKLERSTRDLPLLRQRVVEEPLGIATPRWEVDAAFDLAYHLRLLRAPADGSLRALLDLAEPLVMQGFDRDRSPWELYLIEGLQRGRAALFIKWHPALEGGRGLTALGGALVDRFRAPEPDWVPQPIAAPVTRTVGPLAEVVDAVGSRARSEAAWLGELGVRAATSLALLALTGPRAAVETAAWVAALPETLRGEPSRSPASPLLAERTAALRLDSFHVGLADLARAAKGARATIGDVLAAGMAAGLGLYHELHGTPLEALRMAPPLDRRGGEALLPATCAAMLGSFRFPLASSDPLESIRALHTSAREHRGSHPRPETLSRLLARLPSALSAALLARAGRSVDVATTVLASPTSDLYVSGARVERIVAFAPLAGAAAHLTAFAYDGGLAIGLGSDRAAIPDPEVFIRCVQRGLTDTISFASGRAAARGRQAA